IDDHRRRRPRDRVVRTASQERVVRDGDLVDEETREMTQRGSQLRKPLTAAAVLIVGAVLMVTSLAQAPADRWWPGYGNGPDNARYFPSRQIDKTNVSRLEVAWTYPHGETSSHPIVVRGVVYGRGRNGSLVAIDA